MLNVAIAIDSPVDYGPRAVRVVAAACEEVIGEHRCPVASDLEVGAVTAWYAVVHPSDLALDSVLINFRDRAADGVLIEQRFVSFSGADTQESRLGCQGSVIAALAAAREGPLTRPPERRIVAAPVVQTPVPAALPSPWSFDIAGVATPVLGTGPSRLGGLAAASMDLAGPGFARVSARYAAFSGNPGFSWLTLAVGGGAHTGQRTSRMGLEVSAEAVLEHASITVTRGATQESATRDGAGGRLGVAAVVAIATRYAIVLGADAALVLPRLHVLVEGQPAAEIPFLSLGLHVGLRLRP